MPLPVAAPLDVQLTSTATAVSLRSTDVAVRGTEPSPRRIGSPQLGHVASVRLAWHSQWGHGTRKEGMPEDAAPRERRSSRCRVSSRDMAKLRRYPRERRPDVEVGPKPIFAVWELTMKCDQPCQHCGTRAGHARASELTTAEVLEVAASLADLGCREVTLIGGEAYLRPDLDEIVAYLASRGLRVGMQTGGRALTAARAVRLREVGLSALGVSVDGPAPVHDLLRGNAGSHAAALRALDAGREAGLVLGANTQVSRLGYLHLRETASELRAHGIEAWQVALTVPMGRAADRPEWIINPWSVVLVIDALAAIQREAAGAEGAGERTPRGVPFNVAISNNLGYFGPHELALRSRPSGLEEHWSGCRAGVNVIGIESDGTVKGCPSLPTAAYAGGNVRDLSLEQILGARRGHPLRARSVARRALGLLQDLLLRGHLPRRLLVDGALRARPSGQQPLLLPPRDAAQAPRRARAPRGEGAGSAAALRLRPARNRRGALDRRRGRARAHASSQAAALRGLTGRERPDASKVACGSACEPAPQGKLTATVSAG